MYYVCKGKTNYYETLDKPVYKGNYFNDYYNSLVGYAKTPQELNIEYPFPQEYTDSTGLIWVLRDGEKPDNHQFGTSKERIPKSQLNWISWKKEKKQDYNPKWDSQSAQTPGLWSQLKKYGRIK